MARYALVLGIAKYDNFTNLPKAVNDAEQIVQLLREQGRFDVQPLPSKLIESENPWQIAPDKKLTGKELGQALRIFLLEKAKGHEALIYFAGHGFEAASLTGEAKGYLATSDCHKDGQNAIAFDDLNTLIAKSQLSSLVVLLDCCYAGSLLERSFIKSGFSVFNSKQDYSLITASRAFERAREDDEGGIFTKAILKGLAEDKADEATGEINVNDLMSFISRELKQSGQEAIYMGGGRSIPLVWYPPKNPVAAEVVSEECPYRGLEAFDKDHTKFFFGRQKVVNYIQEKLELAKFVPIIGSSGSGKSSVVRAGLIPELLDNWGWQVLEPIKPGSEPLEELRTAFKKRFQQDDEEEQFQELSNNYPNNLPEIIKNLPGSAQFLLIVDQFEEVFTVCADKEVRQRFIKLLTQVVDIPHSRLAVVITMRADFFAPCLQYPSLNQLIQTQAVYMPPLTEVDLKEIITKPATKQKHSVEKALVVKIIDDVKQEPGFLPLLEFALTKLWDKRDQEKHQLTLEEYEKLGRLTGALDLHAEKVYENQDFEQESPNKKRTQQEKDWIRLIFLGLLRTGEGEKDTRKRQPKATLLDIAGDDPKQRQQLSKLLDRKAGLVKGRLLVTGKDEKGEAWIDLAHEALIEGWERFAQWRQQDRDLRRLIDRLQDTQEEWVKKEQDDKYLMQGGLLAEVRDSWQQLQPYLKLRQVLKDFYKRSDIYEKDRIAELKKALTQAIFSNVDNLTTSAEYANELGSNIEAIKKSIEAGELLKDPSLSGDDKVATKKMRILILLNQLVYGFRERKIFTGHTDQVCGLNFSPDDQKLVSVSMDRSIRIWSLNNGQLMQTIDQQPEGVKDAIFNREGDLLISLIPSLRCETIQSWNLNESKNFDKSNKPLIPEDEFPEKNQVRNIAFSPDNKIIAFDYGRQIKLWYFNEKPIDLLDGQDTHNDNINGLDFSPNSKYLASAGGDGFIKVWNLNAKKLLKEWSLKEAIFSSVKFINNKTIVFSEINGKIIVWDFLDNEQVPLFNKKDEDQKAVNTLAVSPEPAHNFIASGSEDGSIKIWDRKNSKCINGQKGSSLAINRVVFSNKNSQMLASASADGLVKIWTIISPPIIDGWTFCFSPNNYQIVTGSQNDGSIKLWSEDFTLKKTLDNPSNRVQVFKVKFSPDSETIISTSLSKDKDGKKKGIIEIWGSEGELKKTLLTIDKLPPASISFSPDSKTFIPVNRLKKKVNIWKLKELVDGKPPENGNPLYTFSTSENVQDVSFSPDGKSIGVLVGKEIEIWSLTNGEENNAIRLKTPDKNEMVAMSFSPDGKIVAAADIIGTVYLWNLHQITDQTKPHIFTKISNADNIVIDIVFSPGGEAVVLAYNDKTAVIFLDSKNDLNNVENSHVRVLEQPRESLFLHNGFTAQEDYDKSIQQIGFSPDGKLLASSNSRNVVLWNFDFDKLHKIYLDNRSVS